MQTYEITQEQGNKILHYLVTKPYCEVAELVQILQNIKPMVEPEKLTKPKA